MYKRNFSVLEYAPPPPIIYLEFIAKPVSKSCVYVILYDWATHLFDLRIYIVVKYWYENTTRD